MGKSIDLKIFYILSIIFICNIQYLYANLDDLNSQIIPNATSGDGNSTFDGNQTENGNSTKPKKLTEGTLMSTIFSSTLGQLNDYAKEAKLAEKLIADLKKNGTDIDTFFNNMTNNATYEEEWRRNHPQYYGSTTHHYHHYYHSPSFMPLFFGGFGGFGGGWGRPSFGFGRPSYKTAIAMAALPVLARSLNNKHNYKGQYNAGYLSPFGGYNNNKYGSGGSTFNAGGGHYGQNVNYGRTYNPSSYPTNTGTNYGWTNPSQNRPNTGSAGGTNYGWTNPSHNTQQNTGGGANYGWVNPNQNNLNTGGGSGTNQRTGGGTNIGWNIPNSNQPGNNLNTGGGRTSNTGGSHNIGWNIPNTAAKPAATNYGWNSGSSSSGRTSSRGSSGRSGGGRSSGGGRGRG